MRDRKIKDQYSRIISLGPSRPTKAPPSNKAATQLQVSPQHNPKFGHLAVYLANVMLAIVPYVEQDLIVVDFDRHDYTTYIASTGWCILKDLGDFALYYQRTSSFSMRTVSLLMTQSCFIFLATTTVTGLLAVCSRRKGLAMYTKQIRVLETIFPTLCITVILYLQNDGSSLGPGLNLAFRNINNN